MAYIAPALPVVRCTHRTSLQFATGSAYISVEDRMLCFVLIIAGKAHAVGHWPVLLRTAQNIAVFIKREQLTAHGLIGYARTIDRCHELDIVPDNIKRRWH